jgi:hypothetical protein
MTTYKGIRGLTIQTVAGDPSTIQDGDIWYNSVLRKIRGAKTVAAWSSGGNLNTAKRGSGGCGIQTATLNFAGHGPSGYTLTVESHDGSSWTEINNTNTGRNGPGGFGTLTAAMCCGGSIGPGQPGTQNTEEFDGTNWAEQDNLTQTGRGNGAGLGVQTAGIYVAGNVPGTPMMDFAEFYDGSSWTEGADLNSARSGRPSGWGTQTAAGVVGGNADPGSTSIADCELYDGTSWTEVANINDARGRHWGGGTVQTLGMIAGGDAGHPPDVPQSYEAVEQWDGSSWTEVADLATGRADSAGGGPNAAAIRMGGNIFSGTNTTTATEEWNDAPATVTITSS